MNEPPGAQSWSDRLLAQARKRMAFLLSLLLTYLAMAACLLLLENRLIFFPDRRLTETPANHGVSFEEVHATASDGVRLHGWWVPAAPRSDGEPPVPRVPLLFMHGNAGNISDRAENAALLAKLGLDVLLFDYRGYGLSEGSPTEQGLYLDAQAMLDFLCTKAGVDSSGVILFGRSLGAAVATDLATRRAPLALVVESGFCSVKDLAREMFPYSLFTPFLPRHFDNLTKFRSLACPVLVIHGRDDEIIPFGHGQRLYAAARGPRRFFDKGGSHNMFFGTDHPAYWRCWREFVSGLPKQPK